MKSNSQNTSWGKVAGWYDDLLETDESTYQKTLILPNLIRLLEIKKGETILDLACGQGFFSRELHKAGAKVMGLDISEELVKIAQKSSPKEIQFFVSSADKLALIKDGSVDKITLILAVQNIENVKDTFSECTRVLKPSGSFYIVMNHPAFRVPKKSSWGWDEKNSIQYRRIESYLFESKIEIDMHPGERKMEKTVSFHRPLQYYFKNLSKAGLCVVALEEWNSNKTSNSGPRARAENLARKEIPLFLFLEAKKLK